jgi:DNA-binding response OmpR family regulator
MLTSEVLTSKPRIAILEDHEDTREMLCVALQTDFSPIVYESAHDLLIALDQEHFSAIVADIMLPGVDGYEFVRTIRSHAQFGQMCVIAVTALAMGTDREKGMAAGFTDYLVKPITPDDITAVLWRCLKSPNSAGSEPAA